MDDRQTLLIEVLSKKAIRLFWESSFGGMAYGSRHLHRVQKIAEYLRQREGGDKFLVLAGAWVHDVALADGPDCDAERVAHLTRKFLSPFKQLHKYEVDRLVECAEGHELGGNFLSQEAKLVHDADVIDKGGLMGVVRHIWKMTNMLERRILDGEQDLEKLENHLAARKDRLYTKTAIKLAKYLAGDLDDFFQDRRFALEKMNWISRQAQQGIISDKISETLASRREHPCMDGLKSQLACSFLKRNI
jgi:uncharacterized protein